MVVVVGVVVLVLVVQMSSDFSKKVLEVLAMRKLCRRERKTKREWQAFYMARSIAPWSYSGEQRPASCGHRHPERAVTRASGIDRVWCNVARDGCDWSRRRNPGQKLICIFWTMEISLRGIKNFQTQNI